MWPSLHVIVTLIDSRKRIAFFIYRLHNTCEQKAGDQQVHVVK